MKPSHAANDIHVDRTRQVWQPRLGREITDEDTRQITQNVTGFFGILAEWSRAEKPAPANGTGKPSISIPAGCAVKAEAVAEGLGGRNAGGGWTARCPVHDDGDGGWE